MFLSFIIKNYFDEIEKANQSIVPALLASQSENPASSRLVAVSLPAFE